MGISSLCFGLTQPGLRQCSQLGGTGTLPSIFTLLPTTTTILARVLFRQFQIHRQSVNFISPSIKPTKAPTRYDGTYRSSPLSLSPSHRDLIAHSADMISHKRPNTPTPHTLTVPHRLQYGLNQPFFLLFLYPYTLPTTGNVKLTSQPTLLSPRSQLP